jgi:alpha-D-xyloside xylohydrolase
MRSLWLHFPDDPAAVGRGDQFFWGPDILVSPVVEKGATIRRLYLPGGIWHDFWTEERLDGGREIDRAVDLETIPLHVRAGTILPLGRGSRMRPPLRRSIEVRVAGDKPAKTVVFDGRPADLGL